MTDPTQEVSTALAHAVPVSTGVIAAEQWEATWRMARALTASRSFKDVNTPEQAVARIMLGADLGMSPTQALMGIDIVKGNPQIRGVALGRMVRNSARRPLPNGESYDYAVLARDFTRDAEAATVALYRRDEDGTWPRVPEGLPEAEWPVFDTILGPVRIKPGEKIPEGVEAFKLDQAKKRGLVKTDGAWASQPEVMVVWRALSQLVRFYAPDAIGGMPVYTEADGIERVPNLSEGQGSGEGPGWGDMPADLIEQVEAIIAQARALNFAPFADEAVLQQRLNGQTRQTWDRFIKTAREQLDSMAMAEPEPEDATVVDERPLTLTFGGETFTFADEDASLRDAIRSALDSGDNEALIELARRLDAPDNAAPYKAMAVALVREAVGQTGGE